MHKNAKTANISENIVLFCLFFYTQLLGMSDTFIPVPFHSQLVWNLTLCETKEINCPTVSAWINCGCAADTAHGWM